MGAPIATIKISANLDRKLVLTLFMELQISTQPSNFWTNLPLCIKKMGRNQSRKLMILRIYDVIEYVLNILDIKDIFNNFKMERTKTPKIHKGSLMKSQHLQSKYQKKKICSAFFLNKSLVWTSGNSLKVKEVE